MKRLLKNLAIFLIPIIIILIVIEILLRNIPNDYSKKEKYLSENSSKIELLYLGSSHIYFGLNPEYSKYKAYNAAYTSQSIDIDYEILIKYKNWNNLKFIVIPADYISLYSTLETGVEGWRIKNYNIYYHFNKNYFAFNNYELFNGKFKDNIERIKKGYFYNSPVVTSNDLGFGTSYSYPSNNDLYKTSEEAIKRHSVNIEESQYKSNFEKNTKAIQNLVNFAKNKNIKVIFVSTPVSDPYYKDSQNMQLKSTINTFNNIVKTNPKVCYYFDFMNDNNFDVNDFNDGDHLNTKGAEKLTILLDQKLSDL